MDLDLTLGLPIIFNEYGKELLKGWVRKNEPGPKGPGSCLKLKTNSYDFGEVPLLIGSGTANTKL